MRRRKLQKKCNSENATLEVAFFRIFLCICFGAAAFFCIFSFFFRKKNTKVDSKLQTNAMEKMQRRKLQKKCNEENATLEVAFFLHFPFIIFGICIFRCIFRFSGFAQLALWFCLEFSRQRMLLIEGGTATSLGAKDTSLRNCLAHCMSPFLLGNFKIRDVKLDKIVAFWGCIFLVFFFPTCQVRVVRFCQSCSPPPPRLAVLLLLLVLLLLPL